MFGMFLVTTTIGFLFALLFTPDITGKSLEEVHLDFEGPWAFAGLFRRHGYTPVPQ